MPIIKNVEIHWVKCNADQPQRYQNKADAPAKWSLQIRTRDKAQRKAWEDQYGMKMTPSDDDDGIFYKTSLSRYAFSAGTDGKENPDKPNKPVNVILGDGTPVNPDTVGNGSIANVSFFLKDDKSSRTLKGIQLLKLKKYSPPEDQDQFDLTDDYSVIEDVSNADTDAEDPY
jgi:hypothetical protein